MSKEVTSQNIIAAFPYALSQSDNLAALAKVVADELEVLYDNNDLLTIYANIDKLPEDLLDILAKDFKVDWYLYNGTLASKRAQIKSCFYVHRYYGTKGEIVEALSDLCPGTDIEEWFEYGGSPYYFRIVLDVTEQRLPIDHNDIIRIARILKPTRSVLESDAISYRSRNGFLIGVVSGYVFFSTRLCGTYPKAAMQGKIFNDYILVGTNGQQFVYASPKTGAIIAGTFPSAAKQGVLIKNFFLFESDADSTNYTVVKTGIVPAPSKLGTIMEQSIESIESADNYSYAQSVSGTIDTGTFPDASVAGGVEGGNISFDQEGILTAFNAHACGTLPGSLL